MKKLLLIVIITVIACAPDDIRYFNFQIKNISDLEETNSIDLEIISTEDNPEYYAIYDSLLVTYAKNGNELFFINNIHSGDDLGRYCQRGRGPKESVGVLPICELYMDSGDLKADLIAYSESKLMEWNITQSINEQVTVIDSVFDYSANTNGGIFACRYNYRISKDTILIQQVPQPNNGISISTPKFNLIRRNTGEVIREYDLYTPFIKEHDKVEFTPDEFLLSEDCIRPDKKFLAMAMGYFPQINILNLETGETVAYRLKDRPKFTPSEKIWYFSDVEVDDSFIYALYQGINIYTQSSFDDCNSKLYVFDWNGNLIKKIALNNAVKSLWLDRTSSRLYFNNIFDNTPVLHYCDISNVL